MSVGRDNLDENGGRASPRTPKRENGRFLFPTAETCQSVRGHFRTTAAGRARGPLLQKLERW